MTPSNTFTEDNFPKVISVDDHVVEPPDTFERWLPKKFRAAGPKVIRKGVRGFGNVNDGFNLIFDDDSDVKGDCWEFGDLLVPHKRVSASVGFERDDMGLFPITYDEMRPGCYDPHERVLDMEMNWVEKSLCFPTMPRFCGQAFNEHPDRELGLACVKAYNDFTVEEWCGDSDGRLIPLMIIPLWDPELAAKEIERNVARGVRNVTFSEIPSKLGLPSIHSGYWDPFYAACNENEVSIHMHIGSSSNQYFTSADAPVAVGATLTCVNAMASLSDYIFSGILVRYPKLKLSYSESQIGWIPYILERANDVTFSQGAWAQVKDLCPDEPASYFRGHIYGCFFRDQFGLDNLDAIGVDNVTFETDYPHNDTTWPHTKKYAMEMMHNLDDLTVWKIVRGNAITALHLPAEAPPVMPDVQDRDL
jgi:predicted TIM-barrel fold metal-dependent hydrolase